MNNNKNPLAHVKCGQGRESIRKKPLPSQNAGEGQPGGVVVWWMRHLAELGPFLSSLPTVPLILPVPCHGCPLHRCPGAWHGVHGPSSVSSPSHRPCLLLLLALVLVSCCPCVVVSLAPPFHPASRGSQRWWWSGFSSSFIVGSHGGGLGCCGGGQGWSSSTRDPPCKQGLTTVVVGAGHAGPLVFVVNSQNEYLKKIFKKNS